VLTCFFFFFFFFLVRFVRNISKVLCAVPPRAFVLDGHIYHVFVQGARLDRATVLSGKRVSEFWPTDAREGHRTFSANLKLDLCVTSHPVGALKEPLKQLRVLTACNGTKVHAEIDDLWRVPVMVKSSLCPLANLSPLKLIEHGEEPHELGGYFIVNGNEKIIRMTVLQRRHTIVAQVRESFKKRGAGFTTFATAFRSVADDQSAVTLQCHFMREGGVLFRVMIKRSEYYFPAALLLKSLCDCSDRALYDRIVLDDDDPALADRAAFLIGDAQSLLGGALPLTRERCLKYLGKNFRRLLESPEHITDLDVGRDLVQRYIFPHLSDPDGFFDGDDNERKFNVAVEMVRRVYALADGRIAPDTVDAASQWEALMPGHLFAFHLQERMVGWLKLFAGLVSKAMSGTSKEPLDAALITRIARKCPNLGDRLQYMLATGNVISDTGLDMMQYQGFSVVAEKINYLRYMSHFRAIHRGTFFTTMRTTAVRKLLPDSWGFLCPVHTPDGAPCGLLNHLAGDCVVAPSPPDIWRLRAQLVSLVYTLGVLDLATTMVRVGEWRALRRAQPATPPLRLVPVVVDGALVGYVEQGAARGIALRLRALKRAPTWIPTTPAYDAAAPRDDWRVDEAAIPATVEVVFVPYAAVGAVGIGAALYVYPSAARLMRPVRSLVSQRVELIGSFEQVYMEIACGRDTVRHGATTHIELSSTAMLSDAARLTPFSDFNQSPRNIYQCLTVDHDVLTPSGWCPIAAVQPSDAVLTLSTRTGELEWNAVLSKVDRPHTGALYHHRSAHVDAVVTAEHRWLLREPRTGKFLYRTTADAVQLQHRSAQQAVPLTGRNANPLWRFDECASFLPLSIRAADALNVDWCRFVALATRDGAIGADERLAVARSPALDAVLARLGAAAGAHELFASTLLPVRRRAPAYRFASAALAAFFAPIMVGGSASTTEHAAVYRRARSAAVPSAAEASRASQRDRWLFYEPLLTALSRAQARAVLECFECVSSWPLANDLTAVAQLAERRVRLCARQRGAGWTLQVDGDDAEAPLPRPTLLARKPAAHNGRVYCVTVANGNFLTRRRSSLSGAFFTGNCQMAKQTMGTACYAYDHRVDSKLYRLNTPQAPIARTRDQLLYRLNNYAHGVNAVVAVIAYTGYDMEDAMIICKSSMERGMAHGSLYSTKVVELEAHEFFAGEPGRTTLGRDGLPQPGERLQEGDAMYSVFNTEQQRFSVTRYAGVEPATVTVVRAIGKDSTGRCRTASITYRRERNPVIGDKFAARHGQKGTLAQLWPQINMPVSESGIQADIIINPHAFPSRMTIGMLVESLAGKAGALHGRFQDASPFTYGAEAGDINGKREHEVDAVTYFGEQLAAGGYQYHGSEPMYSGVTGEEMQMHIFQGIVYYQRLRHMVKDKYQVRSLGAVHPYTHQPVKGRKRGGGIRFGEMERDALIAHGAAYLLNDRLFRSSDVSQCYACAKCGSLLSVVSRPPTTADARPACVSCQSSEQVRALAIPYVFRYLAHELAAMNIRITLNLEQH
jgi:DNA-directed RNA polymerase beta subunit